MEFKEVQKIGIVMVIMIDIICEQVEWVMDQFGQELGLKILFGVGLDDYICNMLVQVLGSEKVGNLIDCILFGCNIIGLDVLKWMDLCVVVDLVCNEYLQIIVIVMVYLEIDQVVDVLKLLLDCICVDVLLCIVIFDGIFLNVFNEFNEIMECQFVGNQNLKLLNIGGVQCVVNILNFMDSGQDQVILGEIVCIDVLLSNCIQDLMFVFDDLVDLDDCEMQLVLCEVSGECLGLVLCGVDIKVCDKIICNMLQCVVEILFEDMEVRGLVCLFDVEGV